MVKKIIKPEVWTRTVGYFRPVYAMNKGKQAEVKDRYLQDPLDITHKMETIQA